MKFNEIFKTNVDIWIIIDSLNEKPAFIYYQVSYFTGHPNSDKMIEFRDVLKQILISKNLYYNWRSFSEIKNIRYIWDSKFGSDYITFYNDIILNMIHEEEELHIPFIKLVEYYPYMINNKKRNDALWGYFLLLLNNKINYYIDDILE